MKRNHFAMLFAAAAAFTTIGCASESAPADDATLEAEAQSEGEGSFRESRGYAFASKRIERVLDEIDATDPQRATVNALKDRMAEDMFSMREDGRDVRVEALDEWKKGEPDQKRMHALVDERIEAYRKLLHDAVDGAFEVHGTLTPEQRTEIAELVEERMSQRH